MTGQRLRRTSLVAIVFAAIGLASAKVLIVSLQLSLGAQVVLIALALMLACLATCGVTVAIDRRARNKDGTHSDASMAPPRRAAR